MLTQDNATIAIFHELVNDEIRLHLLVNAAGAMHFSIRDKDIPYDEALNQMCKVAPCIARIDGDLAEFYDGNLSCRPAMEDIQTCLGFKRWAKQYDLQSHSDWFEYLSEG